MIVNRKFSMTSFLMNNSIVSQVETIKRSTIPSRDFTPNHKSITIKSSLYIASYRQMKTFTYAGTVELHNSYRFANKTMYHFIKWNYNFKNVP